MPARKSKKPNHRLRAAREQRGWSRKYVAEQVETDPFTVGRWERGTQGTGPYFRQRLCELFGMDALALGLMKEEEKASDASEAPKSIIWIVPFLRNPYCTGFEQLVSDLRERLVAEQGGLSLLALSGLGGIGKTQLALEYAYCYRKDYKQAVLWVHADSPEQLSTDLERLAPFLEVPEARKRQPNPGYLVNEVKQWLREHDDWLLVLDNVEEKVKLDFLFSIGTRGHVLLTTRSERVAGLGQHMMLKKMSMEVGALLLLRVIHEAPAPVGLETFSAMEREEALALARVLDGLPLALEQAGAYMREKGRSLADYRRAYQRYRKIFLAWRSKDTKAYTDYSESVATTWLITFQRVRRQSPAALALLHLCAYLHPDAIPSDIFLKGAHDPASGLQPLAGDDLLCDDAYGVLINYALIRRNAADGMLSVHRLVQAVLKDRMDKNQQRQWAQRTVHAVESAWSNAPASDAERYLPHAYVCATLIKELNVTGEEAARLLERAANAADARGWYTKAMPLYLRAFGAWKDLRGRDDPHVLHLFLDVARAHVKKGIYGSAVLFFRKAYKDCARIFGPDHPITVACLNDLALAELKQGSVQPAIETAAQALQWVNSEPILDSAEGAMTYQMVGEIWQLVGNEDLAQSYYVLALEMRRRVFGQNHPEVAQSLLHLGILYMRHEPTRPELLVRAEQRFREAVEIRSATLGEDHPETAYGKLYLGLLLLQQGDTNQAEALCRQTIASFRRKLGPTHFATGQGVHALASTLSEQKQYREAEECFLEAKEIYRRAGGPESALYLQLLSEYAELLRAVGREDEARQHEDYVETTRQLVINKGPILSFELPSLDEEEESMPGYIFAIPRPDWITPEDLS